MSIKHQHEKLYITNTENHKKNKDMKKLNFALCAMLISIGTLTATTYNNVLIDGIYYNLNDNYRITVDGQNVYIQGAEVTSNPNKYSGNITIPDSVEYEGVKFAVKAIGNNAFQDCSNLTRVVLPESVTSIGGGAFYNCGSLLSINIPEGITSIGGEAFYNCKSLISIQLPNSLVDIPYNCFRYCSNLRSVKLPNNLQTIGQNVFYDCGSLDSITLPSSVTSIGGGTFYLCYALQYANITDLSAWCNIAFGDDSSTPFKYAHHFHLNGEEITELVIPSDITSIKQHTFRWCSYITSVVIPDNVQSVEVNAFTDCSILATISLGANIANLNKDAFSNCTSLKSINWNITNFIDFAAATLNPFYNFRNQITSFTFGENVQHIPAFMCYEMSNLSRIDIPASVTSVGEGAFAYCGRLTEINAAAGSPLYSSEEGVLFNKNKTSLIIYPAGKTAASYIVPNGVQTIEENAFYGCENLASITIPASVTSIGAGNGTIPMWSFEGAVPATITENAFPSDVYIIVDDADTYKAAWPEYASRIFPRQYAEQTLNLTAQADKSSLHLAVGEANLANVIKLTISGTINSYDLMIMRNKMINLRYLDITNAQILASDYEYYTGYHTHRDTLNNHAFRNLLSIKLPNTLELLDSALLDCPTLKYAEVNHGVVGNAAFPYTGQADLKVVLNEGVTEILPYAFADRNIVHCSASYNVTNTMLRELVLPSSLDSIAEKLFWYCTNLESVQLGEKIKKIGNYAFCECSALSKIELPDSLHAIGDFAFQGAGLNNITIPNKVTSIGNGAFMTTFGGRWNSASTYNVMEKDLWRLFRSQTDSYIYGFGINQDTKTMEPFYLGLNAYRNGGVSGHGYTTTPSKLAKIYFSANSQLKAIGLFAFAYCQLDSVNIPASVTAIGKFAFIGNQNMSYLAFGENSTIRTIEEGTFQNCGGLQKVLLPENLQKLDEVAFSLHKGEDNLKHIVLPPNLVTIADGAFYGRKGMEQIDIPTSVQTIGQYAFYDCSSLAEIKVPSTLLSIGNYAFAGCDQITKVYTYTVEPVVINQNTFSCWRKADLYVPSTSYYNYYYNTQWSQFLSLRQFDEEYTYFYINNDYELGGNTGTIDGKPDADLNEESGLIITGDEVQQVGTITLLGDENGAASIIACQDNLSADSLVVRLITKKGLWNYFCFPFDVLLSQLSYPFAHVIREYDGATRAQYGAGGWQDMIGNVLHKGLGYIFQGARTDTIQITIANPHIDCQDYVQEIQAYSAENDIHANWNFIGNPFTSWYDLDVLYESGYSSPVYTWSPSTNDYIAYRPGDDEYHLHPFEGLFTQNPTNGAFSIIWGSNGRETKTQADLKRNDNYGGGGFYARRKARQQRQQEQQRLLINIELSNDDFTARTRVVFNEQARTAYELGIDAAMMDGGKAPLHIWSNQDNNRLAINERPYAGGRVALGYDAREAGFVSLSAARMDKDVILYDNELNQEVDLSQGAYTFYTEAGTNNTRFAIIRIKEKEGEEAALPEVENADETVSVYNLLGQKLIDNVRRGDIQLPTGVYVIENSNGARTEMTIKH